MNAATTITMERKKKPKQRSEISRSQRKSNPASKKGIIVISSIPKRRNKQQPEKLPTKL